MRVDNDGSGGVRLPFMPGLQLSELFYREVVKPILDARLPGMVYSAGLIGPGSDVLGFDTAQSTDHDWGPRLLLFLESAVVETHKVQIDQILAAELPLYVQGYPIDMAHIQGDALAKWEGSPDPAHHGIQLVDFREYFAGYLGTDLDGALRPVDWLAWPEQILRSLTAGKIFHDGLGVLEPIRQKLAYYPHDVWLYLLACQWRRIDQEEPFMGRCGQVEDEIGSRLVAARLVRDIMRLCFLMERQYAPYIKWFGTAFQQLACAAELTPRLTAVLGAANWHEREAQFTGIYEYIAQMHNSLALTETIKPTVAPFHQRPFQILHAHRFVDAIRRQIRDAAVLALPEYLGGVDQFIDSTDVLSRPRRYLATKQLTVKEVPEDPGLWRVPG
jgi:hypothetical protein